MPHGKDTAVRAEARLARRPRVPDRCAQGWASLASLCWAEAGSGTGKPCPQASDKENIAEIRTLGNIIC